MAKLRIGRSDTNDIVLDDSSVSRKHAEIEELSDGVWRLTDVGSSAGTFVKDGGQWTQITSVDVDLDTQVRFGEAEFNLADIVTAEPATIRPSTMSGLGQRAEQGAAEISREMRQPGSIGGPSAGGGSGGSSGLSKNTKILIFGGGGLLALIVIIVVAVVLLEGGGGGGTAGIGGSGAKAQLARMFTERCQSRGKQTSTQCQCMGKEIADSLTEDEAARIISASRENKKPPNEVAIKLLGGALKAARKCTTSG